MKKILYTTIFTLACVFVGCKKSALDLTPQFQLSSDSFWKSENDVKVAVNGCYGYLSNQFNNAYDDASSDNAYAQYPWEGPATAIAAGNIDATLDVGYSSRYIYIRRYNYFLANVDKATISAAAKSKYVAEVRMLRALTYYDLAKTFGSIPLVTASYDLPSETAVTPTPAADVINFAISEINAVMNDLPAANAGGRLTTGAAWALLTRIQLNYGKWNDAVVSAQKVMGMGYQLFRVTSLKPSDTIDDFSSLVTFANSTEKDKFYKGLASYEQQFWAENEQTSKENILVSQNITNSSYVFGNGLRTLLPPSDLGGWSSITPTQELINAYWDKNGNSFSAPSATDRATNYNAGKPNANYLNEFKNRDTRLYASVLFPGVTWNRFADNYTFVWGKGGNNNSATGYNFKKMIDPAFIENDWDGAQDFPIIRYAEILLAYAEAKNEVSGPDATIYAALNDIRDRAGMPPVSQTTYGTQATLRELIRNERRIELAAEGQRYTDIRRWNIGSTVMKSINDITNNPVQSRVWQAKFLLMPYPQVALDRNSNLKATQTAKGY